MKKNIVLQLIGLILILIGIRPIFSYYKDVKEYRKFEKNSKIAIATILGEDITDSEKNTIFASRYVRYEFKDARGQKYTIREKLGHNDFDRLNEGKRALILYSPRNPQLSRLGALEGAHISKYNTFLPFILVLNSGVATLFLAWMLRIDELQKKKSAQA
ncbi:MAG: hypothetical protein ISS45_04585 [Candidatus Omnitrophica bacterium]|nr:hypothetical protein [Candidatus Omnitrophota bacterium]